MLSTQPFYYKTNRIFYYFTKVILLLSFFIYLYCFASCIEITNKNATSELDSTNIFVPKDLSLVFGGDVMVHSPQITASYKDGGYDFSETFQYIKPFLDSADLVVLNFETTISANGRFTGYPMFSSPPEIIDALKGAGADILMLANNHICDKGAEGIRSTVSAIESAGLKYTGAFADSTSYREKHPLYVESSGLRIAFLNYTYGTNGMPIPSGMAVNIIDHDKITSDLASIDHDSTDHVVVFLHWGDEYARKPHKFQQQIAEICHANGADIVIGSHPHVIQPAETLTDSLTGRTTGITVYSLGNLVSNQQWRYSDGGMLSRIDIKYDDPDNPDIPDISAQHRFVWVYTPYEEGRKKYKILPPSVADTMLAKQSHILERYRQFIRDSELLMYGQTSGD